jgi:hypothetical protein
MTVAKETHIPWLRMTGIVEGRRKTLQNVVDISDNLS